MSNNNNAGDGEKPTLAQFARNPGAYDASAVDKVELAQFLCGGERRPLQDKHGSAEAGTQAAHRVPHVTARDVIGDNIDKLTTHDIVEIVAAVDGDTRIQLAEHNHNHSRLEKKITQARAGHGEELDYEARKRVEIQVKRVVRLHDDDKLGERNAKLVLKKIGESYNGYTTVLRDVAANMDKRDLSGKARAVLNNAIDGLVSEIELAMENLVLREDGTISGASALVRRGLHAETVDGKADKRFTAWKSGHVDDDGRPVDHKAIRDSAKAAATNDDLSLRKTSKFASEFKVFNVNGSPNKDALPIRNGTCEIKGGKVFVVAKDAGRSPLRAKAKAKATPSTPTAKGKAKAKATPSTPMTKTTPPKATPKAKAAPSTPNGQTIQTGARGAEYYINGNGNRTYLSSTSSSPASSSSASPARSSPARSSPARSSPARSSPARSSPARSSCSPSTPSGQTIHTGPRGGSYVFTSTGNKRYV